MVCSLGGGRMAVMARVLAAGSFSQPISEDVCQQKLAAQLICRDFREADEPNLLDEEDMDVYGLKPMADPLHLVSCNACKKPIKASQYAAHAELCRLMKSTNESVLELDCGVGPKKPPRKERKKLLFTYATVLPLTAASKPLLDGQKGTISFFSVLEKRNSTNADLASIEYASGVGPGNSNHSACVMPPPRKCSKLMEGKRQALANDLETVSGRNSPKRASSGSEILDDSISGYKKPGRVPKKFLLTRDIPAPLATKIYYSQRNNRLRAALTYLYQESVASNKGPCGVVEDQQMTRETASPCLFSSQGDHSCQLVNDLHCKKVDVHLMPSTPNSDQGLPQNSELLLHKSRGSLPALNFPNQFSRDNGPRPQVSPV